MVGKSEKNKTNSLNTERGVSEKSSASPAENQGEIKLFLEEISIFIKRTSLPSLK